MVLLSRYAEDGASFKPQAYLEKWVRISACQALPYGRFAGIASPPILSESSLGILSVPSFVTLVAPYLVAVYRLGHREILHLCVPLKEDSVTQGMFSALLRKKSKSPNLTGSP